MKRNLDIAREEHMYLDVYYFYRRSDIPSLELGEPGDIENTILHSGDGLENRMIAKDLLYKFNEMLISETGKGFNLKNRLNGYCVAAIPWHIKKRFAKFINEQV